MIDFETAAARIAVIARPLGVEQVALAAARGRVLAQDVAARCAAPPVAVSAMDGYAVRDGDLAGAPVRLPIVGAAFAGAGFQGALPVGSCVRIFTGAPVPQGADRIVIQEDVVRDGDLACFAAPPAGRRHMRPAGSDFRAGDVLVTAGSRLNPQRLIAAAAADLAQLTVFRRPRVLLLATGDELVDPGQQAGRRQAIPESVSFGVAALAEDWGAEVVGRWRCGDDLDALRAMAAHGVEAADVVVVTGGASVGERDFAQAMFAPLGLELVFAKVAMKPGKPIWVGRAGGAIIVGLPGNPTSALVTARLFLAPLLAGLGGRDPNEAWAWRKAPLSADLVCCGDRETFYRARSVGAGVEVLADQDAASQWALAQADLLVRRRPGAIGAAADEPVECLHL